MSRRSVSRMSRNAEEGFKDYKMLYESGVNLVFLNEPLINTSVFNSTNQTAPNSFLYSLITISFICSTESAQLLSSHVVMMARSPLTKNVVL